MLKKSAILLISLIVFLFVLEKGYDFFLKKNCNLKSSYVSMGGIDADVLILGACVSERTVSPTQLDTIIGLKSYNLSTNHSNYAENFAHYHLYLKNNKPPKYLFLYVTAETINGDFNILNTFRFPQFLDDTLISNVVKDYDSEYYSYSSIPFMKHAYYNNYITFNVIQGIKHYLKNRKYSYHIGGFEKPRTTEWDSTLFDFIQDYPNGLKFKWNEKEEAYLTKIVELSEKNNTEVILYESPVIKDAKPYFLNRDEIIMKTDSFAKQMDLEYWNFDTMNISNSREYFLSIYNTNEKGSEIFTNTLGKVFNERKQN